MESRPAFRFRFVSRFRPRRAGFEWAALLDLGLLLLLFLLAGSRFVLQPAVTIELPQQPFTNGVGSRSLVVTLSREELVFFNDERTTLDGLMSAFRQAAYADPEAVLLVEADAQVPYRMISRVYGMAQEAGIAQVALATSILEPSDSTGEP